MAVAVCACSYSLQPAVSCGNVGQMAVDVIINTLVVDADIVRVGFLWSCHSLPVAGNNAFSTSGSKRKQPTSTSTALCVNLEVYNVVSAPVSLLQIRSLAEKGREEAFSADVCAWAASAGFSQVVVLGGADATMRSDEQLSGYEHPG